MTDATTVYRLDLGNLPYVSPNTRGHWRRRSEANRVWRRTAWALAREQKIPPAAKIRVALTMHAGDRRRRDPDNLVSGVLKPCIDGLRDAGVIVDDTGEQVVAVWPVITADKPRRFTLDVEILEPAEVDA